jgi:hypothetical protein
MGMAGLREDSRMGLTQPAHLTSLVLRTDFSDDQAWGTLQATVNMSCEYPCATYVSDQADAGVSIQELVETHSSSGDYIGYLVLADAVTMRDPEQPLLAVDLNREPGRTFRVPPRWYAEISANLTIANLSFDDFANAADALGTYRGFGGGEPG